MKPNRFFCLLLVLLVGLVAVVQAQAAAGRFIQVQGRVDFLRQGKLPAAPAQLNGEVEVGDIVRTKSASRAQIQFVDDTVLTIGPESRVAVEQYLFDPQKGQRQAVLQVFLGLVKTAVAKIYQADQPDFVIKTHTAVMGVRGTEWLTYLLPNRTDIYVYRACETNRTVIPERCGLEVRNIFPEIAGLMLVKSGQYTQVGADQPPTPPVPFTRDDVKPLENLLDLLDGSRASVFPLDTPPAGFRFPGKPLADGSLPPFGDGLPGEQDQVRNLQGGLYVPPRVPPPGEAIIIRPRAQ
ncbi:MAG: FecR family protein [Deltaproteobacteria bacterium]|nr:FecR family protein [Deltaproteobacteria bacterium]